MVTRSASTAKPPFNRWRAALANRVPTKRVITTLVVLAVVMIVFGTFTVTCLGVGVYYRGVIPMGGKRAQMNIDELTVITAMERAQSKDNSVDIVFTGGSTCNRGVDPKLFEKQTGLTAYNLASNRMAGMRVWYWTCEAYLQNHPAPRAIVLCLSPVDIMCIVGETPKTSHDELDPDDIEQRFSLAYGTYLPFLQVILSHGNRWQSYYIDRGLRILQSGLLGMIPGYVTNPLDRSIYGGGGGEYSAEKEKLFQAGGYRSLKERTTAFGQTGLVFRDGEPQGSLALTQTVVPLADDYVRAYAKLAKQHHTRLLFFLTPISREALFDTTALYSWMHQLQKDWPNVEVVTPELLLYEPDLFFDSHHINLRGSKKFTAEVAVMVKALLNAR